MLQENPALFESNVRRAMQGGSVGGHSFARVI